MTGTIMLVGVASLLGCAALTAAVRKAAVAFGVLDVPNARSSHSRVTPRGGGLAIVLSTLLAFTMLEILGVLGVRLWAALTAGGLVLAVLGAVDDLRPLPASLRLAVHFLAAGWAVACIGGVPGMGRLGDLVALLGVVWAINLFNFMDGIDGIAASEAAFIALGSILPMSIGHAGSAVTAASLALGCASLGFLAWNWPPAKIFMGDVGSVYLGYAIAVLALSSSRSSSTAVWVWLILGGAFFVDATVTLLRRVLSGAPAGQAHRTHAYQRLARQHGHGKVTLAVWLLNVLWLLPWAVVAAVWPAQWLPAVAVALLPMIVLVVLAGAGRAEVAND
jgi:Fuc2NAc and GlcNAc transferase